MDFNRLSPRAHAVLVPLAALTLAALFVVEQSQRVVPSPWHDAMLQAAERSARAAGAVKRHRLERGAFVDAVNDPLETALIGQAFTQITTDRGDLDAKLASTDPNFAAVVVAMAHELGLARGDCVAVAMTGSFPALNLSTLAALETLGVAPVLISSVGASNFGATDPYFTWLDIERIAAEARVLTTRSVAASLGGSKDIGRGLAPKGRTLLREAIARNGIPLLDHTPLEASIAARMAIYRDGCAPRPVAAYINVGGGVASLGHALNSELIPIGPSPHMPARNYPARGTLLRFAADGTPVIQLLKIRQLRRDYGLLPLRDDTPPMPGQGAVYGQMRYDLAQTGLATTLLLGLLIGLYARDRRIHALGQSDPEPPPGGTSS
ncbi:MAG: poly-gamma-glutamate system protein [Acidobacteriota bacterium]